MENENSGTHVYIIYLHMHKAIGSLTYATHMVACGIGNWSERWNACGACQMKGLN